MILEFYGAYSAFAASFALGAFFGLIYDIFRIFRISRIPYLAPQGRFFEWIKIPAKNPAKPRKATKVLCFSDSVLTFAEDILFWIIVSVSEVLFIYHINGGVIRFYFFIFTFIGASLYFSTIGKITVYFSVRIIFLIRCLLYWSFYIIIYPVRLIWVLLKKTWKFIVSVTVMPIYRAITLNMAKSYSRKRINRILEHSKKGFFTYD